MSNWQWVGFTLSMFYAMVWLGFCLGLTHVDKHKDRPVLLILVIGLFWPLLVGGLAGAAWHRFMTDSVDDVT